VDTHHHGQFFFLDLGPSVLPGSDPLKGLTGTVRLTDESGVEIERIALDESLKCEANNPRLYPLGLPLTLSEGRSTMTVEIVTGAPALVGQDTTISSRLFICELEILPAMFWGLLSGMAGIPAVLGWLIALVRVALQARRGLTSRREPPSTAPR
jgi:hypothetical protein